MHSTQLLGGALVLAGYGKDTHPPIMRLALIYTAALAQGEAQSKVVCDAKTKICYSSYSDAESGMTFGVALPENVTDPYDAIIKITAPINNKWGGFSWGGNMVWNPLTLAWANGKSGVASARFALYVSLLNIYVSFS
jgi:hypothetical protein